MVDTNTLLSGMLVPALSQDASQFHVLVNVCRRKGAAQLTYPRLLGLKWGILAPT